MIQKYFYSLIWILILSGMCFGQKDLAKLKNELQNKLDELQIEEKFPGATFALVLEDDRIINLSTGVSDSATQRAMKPNDKMFLGSTGKTFVAAVLMQLVEKGKINLDDKVCKYLGTYNWYKRIPNHKDMTIRMLCNHTSGLPRYIFAKEFGKDIVSSPDKIWKPEELIAYILDEKPKHPAGKGWGYSDTNYILIGMIIEKICGNTFYNEVENRFLKPFELSNILPSVSRTPRGLVQGYSGEASFMTIPDKVIVDGKYFVNPQFEWCGGGFISAASDLAIWTKLFYGGKILDENSMKEVLLPIDVRTANVAEEGYGMAAMINKTKFGWKYGHTGLMPGYITEIGYYKEYDFAIVLQINQDNSQGKRKNLKNYSIELAEVVINNM